MATRLEIWGSGGTSRGVDRSIVGGVITFLVQRFESQRLRRLDRTLKLFEHWHSSDSLVARSKAHDVLAANSLSPSRGVGRSYMSISTPKELNPSGLQSLV